MLPAPTQGRGALRDSGPSGCEGDCSKTERHASSVLLLQRGQLKSRLQYLQGCQIFWGVAIISQRESVHIRFSIKRDPVQSDKRTNRKGRFLTFKNNSSRTFLKTKKFTGLQLFYFSYIKTVGNRKLKKVMVQQLAMNIPKIPLLKTKPLFTHVSKTTNLYH